MLRQGERPAAGQPLYGLVNGVPTLSLYVTRRFDMRTGEPVHLLAVPNLEENDKAQDLACAQDEETMLSTVLVATKTLSGLLKRPKPNHAEAYESWGTLADEQGVYMTPNVEAMLAMAENLSALPLAVDQLAFEMSASNEEDETPAYAESVNHSGRAAPKRLAQPRMEERTRRSVPFGGGGIDSGSEESLGALREEIGMRRRSDKRGAPKKKSGGRVEEPMRQEDRPAGDENPRDAVITALLEELLAKRRRRRKTGDDDGSSGNDSSDDGHGRDSRSGRGIQRRRNRQGKQGT